MPGLDTQRLEGALIDVAEPFVAEQVNDANPLSDIMEFDDHSFSGREKTYSAHVGRNNSVMESREDGASAGAGSQQHIKLRIDQRKATGRMEITYEALHDGMKGEGSFIDALEDEQTRLIKDFANRQEQWLTLDGRGVRARVDEADPDGDTTLELDAPGGITGDDFGNRFIMVEDVLGFVNPSTGALRSSSTKATVTAVNSDGTDVTVDATGNVGTAAANSDYVVRCATTSTTSIADTSYEAAWMGLDGIIDDGTVRSNYFGVDRNTWDEFNSYVVSSTGALSLDLLQRVADVVDQKLGGQISLILCHHSIRRLYLQLLEADRRYSGERLMSPDGGTKAFKQGDLTMGEVPIRAIRDFALGQMILLDVDGVGLIQYVSTKGEWVRDGGMNGSVLHLVGVGSNFKDKWEAVYRIRKQCHGRHPAKAAKLTGITGQTLVVVRPGGM